MCVHEIRYISTNSWLSKSKSTNESFNHSTLEATVSVKFGG